MQDPEMHDLRTTFDRAADSYHLSRPRYPHAVFDRIEHAAASVGWAEPLDILEIGPATGVATEVLAGRGHRVTGIELGARLAEHARRHLRHFPHVEVVHASFDSWEPPRWGSYDLVAAATSWHWLDPARRYVRAHRHLRPGGLLAFWSAHHVVPVDGDPFFRDIQPVYDEIGESLPGDWSFPRPGELADHAVEIEASGRFEVLTIEHHDWEIAYDADGYLALLDTFSGHIAMEPWKRTRLHEAIREKLARRNDGMLRRHWGCVLHIAQRREP